MGPSILRLLWSCWPRIRSVEFQSRKLSGATFTVSFAHCDCILPAFRSRNFWILRTCQTTLMGIVWMLSTRTISIVSSDT